MPVLMASTGSSLDADNAGRIPDINPMMAEITVPMNIFLKERTNSKSPVNCEAMIDTINTNTKPIKPPITAKITASKRN